MSDNEGQDGHDVKRIGSNSGYAKSCCCSKDSLEGQSIACTTGVPGIRATQTWQYGNDRRVNFLTGADGFPNTDLLYKTIS